MSDMPERLLAWPSVHNYQRVSLAGGRPNDAVEYVRANTIPAVKPTVKPLVWQFEQEDVQVADTSARHQYRIVFDRRATVGAWMWFCDGQWICLETEEAAKAAAQADYEARTLSALDMQPTVSPELLATTNDVAALLGAAEKVIKSYWHSTDGVITGIYDLEVALARVKGENK